MLVAERRLGPAVAQDGHDVGQAHAAAQGLRNHDRRGRVAETVEDEVLNPGLLPDPLDEAISEGRLHEALAPAEGEHVVVLLLEAVEDLPDRGRDRDCLFLALLRLGALEDDPVALDRGPSQVQELAGSHAGEEEQPDDPTGVAHDPVLRPGFLLDLPGRDQDSLYFVGGVCPALPVDGVRPDGSGRIRAWMQPILDGPGKESLEELEVVVDRPQT